MSQWLDEHGEVLSRVTEDLRRQGVKETRREGLPVEADMLSRWLIELLKGEAEAGRGGARQQDRSYCLEAYGERRNISATGRTNTGSIAD